MDQIETQGARRMTASCKQGMDHAMSNVIRPKFGRPPVELDKLPPALPNEKDFSRVFGNVASYIVGMIRDNSITCEPMFRVVIESMEFGSRETIAALTACPENEIDAELIAIAALRSVKFVDSTNLHDK